MELFCKSNTNNCSCCNAQKDVVVNLNHKSYRNMQKFVKKFSNKNASPSKSVKQIHRLKCTRKIVIMTAAKIQRKKTSGKNKVSNLEISSKGPEANNANLSKMIEFNVQYVLVSSMRKLQKGISNSVRIRTKRIGRGLNDKPWIDKHLSSNTSYIE